MKNTHGLLFVDWWTIMNFFLISFTKFFLFFFCNLISFIFFLGFFNLFELKNYTNPHGLCFVDVYDTTACIEKKKLRRKKWTHWANATSWRVHPPQHNPHQYDIHTSTHAQKTTLTHAVLMTMVIFVYLTLVIVIPGIQLYHHSRDNKIFKTSSKLINSLHNLAPWYSCYT